MNDIEPLFKQVYICETFEPCNVVEHLGHFYGIVPSLACFLTKQHGVCSGKYLFKTPGNAISETLNFKISLDASALKNLCLWCKFQSHLLFIIGLLLKNVLTALNTGAYKVSVHKFPGYVQSPRFGNIFCQKCGCSQELIFNTNYWYTPLTPALCARLKEMSVLKRVN